MTTNKFMQTSQSEHKARIKAFRERIQIQPIMIEEMEKVLLVSLYLDWFNNFLTVDHFSSYYLLSKDQALDLIAAAKHYLMLKGGSQYGLCKTNME